LVLPPNPGPGATLKQDRDKLQNDVRVLDSKDPAGLRMDGLELATDVPVGFSVVAALTTCGTTDVNFDVGEVMGQMVTSLIPH
jgi:hypothetical protein